MPIQLRGDIESSGRREPDTSGLVGSNFFRPKPEPGPSKIQDFLGLTSPDLKFLPAITRYPDLKNLTSAYNFQHLIKGEWATPDQLEAIEEYIKRYLKSKESGEPLTFALNAETGSGKTFVSIMLAAFTLAEYGLTADNQQETDCKIIFAVQSNVLVQQFYDEIQAFFKTELFSADFLVKLHEADQSQEERKAIWEAQGAKLIVATYQTVENDFLGTPSQTGEGGEPVTSLVDSNIAFYVEDEAQNATKKHSAAELNQYFIPVNRLIMTATFPDGKGKDAEKRYEYQKTNRIRPDEFFVMGKPNPGEGFEISESIISCPPDIISVKAISQLRRLGERAALEIIEQINEIEQMEINVPDSERSYFAALDNFKEKIKNSVLGKHSDYFRIPSRVELQRFNQFGNAMEEGLKASGINPSWNFYQTRFNVEILEDIKRFSGYILEETPYTFFAQAVDNVSEIFSTSGKSLTQKEENKLRHRRQKYQKLFCCSEMEAVFDLYGMTDVYQTLRHQIELFMWPERRSAGNLHYDQSELTANLLDDFLMLDVAKGAGKVQQVLQLLAEAEASGESSLTLVENRATTDFLTELARREGFAAVGLKGASGSKKVREVLRNSLERYRKGELKHAFGTFALTSTGLNIHGIRQLNFFGKPDSWIKNTQARGRAGRGKGVVLSHDINYFYASKQELGKINKVRTGSEQERIKRVIQVNKRRSEDLQLF